MTVKHATSKTGATGSNNKKKAKSKKKAVVKKVTVKKTAPKKAVAKRTAAKKSRAAVDPETRYKMIAEAAFLRAESADFTSDPLVDWLAAEREIDAQLKM